jgi:hypothetical protein
MTQKKDISETALIKMDQILEDQVSLVYPSLSTRKFSSGHGQKAKNLGIIAGYDLYIKPGLGKKKLFQIGVDP